MAAGTICTGKTSWVEVVGENGESAAATMENENPSVNAAIVLEGTEVTEDFRCDRARVWVNTNEIVTHVPLIG